jgi:hypothetical protein
MRRACVVMLAPPNKGCALARALLPDAARHTESHVETLIIYELGLNQITTRLL